ncbi:hypothetical protein F5B21DRAFT_479194 [Xylaria acuta]|nr:hypothetical protein F5B21DRAFT_479194 [Xylaria acuta]
MARPLSFPLRRVLASSCAATTRKTTIIHFSKRHHFIDALKLAMNTPILNAADGAWNLLARFGHMLGHNCAVIDGNQLRKLSLALGRRELHPGLDIKADMADYGTALPPGYHMPYFTTGGVAEELAIDPHEVKTAAPWPFTRKMWTGGRMRWLGEDVTLEVNDYAEERIKLIGTAPGKSEDGSEVVLAQIAMEVWGPKGRAITEERSWVFHREATAPSPAAEKAMHDAVIGGPSTVKDVPRDGAYPQRHLRWSLMDLFRFSALTLDRRVIRYDLAWSTAVEEHPTSVVHVMLLLINMLDYWRDHCLDRGLELREIRYQVVAPVYAGETYVISADRVRGAAGDGFLRWDLVVSKEGKTCMTGDILGM